MSNRNHRAGAKTLRHSIVLFPLDSSAARERESGGIAMRRWRTVWEYAVTAGVPRRSFVAALLVGSILNLINQGDALFGGNPLDWTKLLLTYLVPYCVTTYGAVSFRLDVARRAGDHLSR
jgi:hypothetical protein